MKNKGTENVFHHFKYRRISKPILENHTLRDQTEGAPQLCGACENFLKNARGNSNSALCNKGQRANLARCPQCHTVAKRIYGHFTFSMFLKDVCATS